MKTTRCTVCRSEFSDEELLDAHACPACNTSGVPCRIADDVDIRISWHELRVLAMWASNYAANALASDEYRDSRRALATILRQLQQQHPDKAPLTLRGELQELATVFGATVEFHQGGAVEKIDPEGKH